MARRSVTKVTRHSYGSRLMDSIKGVAAGAVMVLIAFPLLFWNEGRAVTTAKSLAELAGDLVTVAPDTIDGSHDGKPVHTTGEAVTEATVSDASFGITEEGALKLRRVVEMYQWQERTETETVQNVGGSEDRITTYHYDTVWSENHIDSSRFEESYDHQNPSRMPYQGAEQVASPITLGAFTLSDRLVTQIRSAEPRRFSDEDLANVPADVREAAEGRPLTVRDGVLYASHTPGSPMVGDFRVRFEVVRPQTVSVIARQSGSDLVPHQTQAGDAIARLQIGVHEADAMIAAAEAENTMMTWILRAVGFFLMFMGFNLVFKPLSVAGSVLPLLGNILAAGTGIVAFALAFGLSMITIAVGWLFYRPLAGILLLAVGGAAIYGIKRLGAKKAAEAPPAPTEGEPPADSQAAA
jgi:hypothetical protein